MLVIHNTEDGKIDETNYWASAYNGHGLAYLSGHGGTLRLLLPNQYAKDWLKEIETAESVTIEPPVRKGYTTHIDIVFQDGTDNPFSLCIDLFRQVQGLPAQKNVRLLVYAGSLKNVLEFPCEIAKDVLLGQGR